MYTFDFNFKFSTFRNIELTLNDFILETFTSMSISFPFLKISISITKFTNLNFLVDSHNGNVLILYPSLIFLCTDYHDS